METQTSNESQTVAVAQKLAGTLANGDLLCLYGPLGAGKTVFARAVIRALANNPNLEVPSPTFTLLQTYDAPIGPVSHFDLYRLADPEDIYELGWEEALAAGIVIVEWPERLGPLLPARHLDIRLSNPDNNPHARTIEIIRKG